MNFVYQNYLHFELLLVESDKKIFSSDILYIYFIIEFKIFNFNMCENFINGSLKTEEIKFCPIYYRFLRKHQPATVDLIPHNGESYYRFLRKHQLATVDLIPHNGESLASQQTVGEGIKASMTGMMWME